MKIEFGPNGPCCKEVYGLVVTLQIGGHVDVKEVRKYLDAAKGAGASDDVGFFVALVVGHSIVEHGATLEGAMEFTKRTGVPDVRVETRAREATAADIVGNCDINSALLKLLLDGGKLPDPVAQEIKAMAEVAHLPQDFSEPQTVSCLHMMKAHEVKADVAVQEARCDEDFVRFQRHLN